MTSTPSKLITELSQLLELDEPTIKEQIWPQLSSMKSSTEVSIYLEGLLGTSTPSRQFITTYTNSRFPTNKSNSSAATTTAFPPPPQSNSAKPNNNNSRSNAPNFNNRNQNNNSQQQQLQFHQQQQQQEIERRKLIEREFEGSGGKVYLKHRDEDYSLGGKKSRGVSPAGSGTVTPVYASSSNNSTSSQSLPISKLNPALLKATNAVQPQNNSSSNKNQQKGAAVVKEEEGLVPLSEKATMELLEIDRVLRTFEKGKGSVRECFCQARIHTLSQHTPICPKCALVICSLNLPISPCPSCLHSPLLSPSASATFISSLHSRREIIIQQETLRIAREKVQEQAEKAAIRFPTLGMAGSGDGYGSGSNGGGGGGLGGGRNYSNIAGAGPDLNDRIEKAYIEGVSLNGRTFGGSKSTSNSSNGGGGGGRVLKLDMKTKKVKIQTKVVKKILKEVKQQEAVANGVTLDEIEDEEDEDESGAGWYDEKDDGYQTRHSSNQQKKLGAAPIDRPFLNVTLDENSRPIWTEEIVQEEEEEIMIVDPLKGVSRGVPGAAKTEDNKGEGKKKSRNKVRKGTGVV